MMDNDADQREIIDHNRYTWDQQVLRENRWTVPVSSEMVENARKGQWEVLLTPTKLVPRDWFPPMEGLCVLGLASAGGQQGPLFAAAGAKVTMVDLSEGQLQQDRNVAEREGLDLLCVQGEMSDLSRFEDASFDLVFHPVSNCFVPEIQAVWNEAFRVLRRGGALLSGFANPLVYMVPDDEEASQRNPVLAHAVPYSDAKSLSSERRREYREKGWPLEFGHTLTQQIGGQLDAGFVICGFYEDWHHLTDHPLNRLSPSFIATRALKP